jgi:glycosyltransferase involved in cell wall biosynthesis
MKLSITIATFYRKDGSTERYLSRTLQSIKNQTYQDYMVYLIGDDYDKEEELISMSKIIDKDKMTLVNLPIAMERSKYRGKDLWVCGGCNAYNTAIDMSINDGLNYICHLDHDDYWLPHHLEEIHNAIITTKSNFICTLSDYQSRTILPEINSDLKLINFIPRPNSLVHSSVCVNFPYFNMKYRNTIEECGVAYASDADLWERMGQFLISRNEFGICVNTKTVIKDSEMSVINEPHLI